MRKTTSSSKIRRTVPLNTIIYSPGIYRWRNSNCIYDPGPVLPYVSVSVFRLPDRVLPGAGEDDNVLRALGSLQVRLSKIQEKKISKHWTQSQTCNIWKKNSSTSNLKSSAFIFKFFRVPPPSSLPLILET